jgi:type II secretory pathway pseudopilin PulG
MDARQQRLLKSRSRSERGYAMAALLVAMTIMAIFLSMALPAWRTAAQREKEAELIFRGEQYARAIALFQRKYANTFPPNLQILLDGHFLRKKYKDPMTEDGEFQLVYANQQASAQPNAGGVVPTQGQPAQRTTTVGGGTSIGAQGGIIGVASKSTATSLRVYNGHDKYNEWVFVAQQASGRIGAPNASQTPTGGINLPGGLPGGRGGRGGPQTPNGRGNFPPGQGPGRGPGNQPPGPFGPRGGTQPTPFGTPFGAPGGVFGPGPGRGGR